MKKITLILCAFFLLNGIKANAQNAPVTTIGTVFSDETTLTVHLTATGFVNIGSSQMRLFYDPTIVTATSVSLGQELVSKVHINTNLSIPGQITLSWFKLILGSLNLPDNSVVLSITFSKLGNGITEIEASEDFCKWFDTNYSQLNQTPFADYYINGYIITKVNAPLTSVPNLSANINDMVDVPVMVSDFAHIGSFSLRLDFDATVLNYQNFNNTSSFPQLNVNSDTPGTLIIEGNSGNSGITLPDQTTLFSLNFIYNGGETELEWIDDGTSCQYLIWPTNHVLNDIPQEIFYINGSVTEILPVFVICPDNIIADNDVGQCGASRSFVADAGGITQPVVSYSIDGEPIVSPHYFPVGTTTVDVTATNESGTATCSFLITVLDKEAPVVEAPGSSSVECIAEVSQPYPPDATDVCDGLISGVFHSVNPTPATDLCEEEIVYTFSYTDLSGNTSYWTYTYFLSRNTFPTEFGEPAPTASTVSCAEFAVEPDLPVVEDVCGSYLTPTEASPIIGGNYAGCDGTIVYSYVFEDCAGLQFVWSYTYTIVYEDFDMPGNVSETVACASDIDEPAPPSVTDACGNQITPDFKGSTEVPECEGTVVYTWNYEDCAGHNHDWTHTFIIEYQDFDMPGNVSETVSCASEIEQPEPPVVYDNCGTEITPTYSGVSETPECEGTVVYTWNYEDCAGHNHDWTHTYTILPTTGPQLTDPEAGCESLNQENLVWNLAQAEAFDASALEDDVAALYQDNCGGMVTANLKHSYGDGTNTDQIWFYSYIFEITDICDNTLECTVIYSGGVETQEPDDHIDLPSIIVNEGDTLCFGAKVSITVQNGLVVNGGSITLIANELIKLMPGVLVHSGGYLHAYLSESLCENPTPLVGAKETEALISKENDSNIKPEAFFRIYPNPTTGVFTLELSDNPDSTEITVEIFNIVGEKLLNTRLHGSNKYDFDLGSLTRGVYIVRVLNGENAGLEKVIKQ